jgi:hypothetical protein
MPIRPETMRVMLATQPVDFRKGMEGLTAHIANTFNCLSSYKMGHQSGLNIGGSGSVA